MKGSFDIFLGIPGRLMPTYIYTLIHYYIICFRCYVLTEHLGREGYSEIHQRCVPIIIFIYL